MAETGFLTGTTSYQDDGSYADVTNPNNVHAIDTNDATPVGSGSGQFSVCFLQGYPFAANGLTSDATLTGIEIRVTAADAFGGDDGVWVEFGLVNGGAGNEDDWDLLTNTHRTTNWVNADGYTAKVLGNSSTILGDVTTPADLLSGFFAIAMMMGSNNNWPQDCRVRTVEINVHFTPAGGGASPSPYFEHYFRHLLAGN